MKSINTLIPALTTLFLVSCAQWTPPMNAADTLNPEDAYMYGRFYIDSEEAALGFDGYKSIGMVFSCKDENEYTIRFVRDETVQAIPVAPSECSLSELIYTDTDGHVKKRRDMKGEFFQNLVFKQGTAYYLGDFYAIATYTATYDAGYFEWKISSAKNEFSKTTQELKNKYVNLKSVDTESFFN